MLQAAYLQTSNVDTYVYVACIGHFGVYTYPLIRTRKYLNTHLRYELIHILYVCVYICIYIYIYKYIHIFIYMFIYIYKCVRVHVNIQLYTYTHTYVYIQIHVHICMYSMCMGRFRNIQLHSYGYMWIYSYLHVYIYVYMYIRMCMQCVYGSIVYVNEFTLNFCKLATHNKPQPFIKDVYKISARFLWSQNKK